MSEILRAENISKRFRISRNRPLTLKESFIQRLRGRNDPGSDLWALRNVSFNLYRGTALGIIGHNGAGKSTLLRLLCGLGCPTTGSILRKGQVGSLLELGSGFHPDMTGRENLITGGILSGMRKQQAESRQDDVIAFAELENFIDQPVRTYSSGMYVRLAFSSAIQMDPDILVVDEILAVGDSRFQRKCIEQLKDFHLSNKALVIASHDLEQIRNLCDEVLVLEEGRVAMQGDPESAIDCYNELMKQRTEKRRAKLAGTALPQTSIKEEGTRMGTLEAVISGVYLYDANGKLTDMMYCGDSLTIVLEYNHAVSVSDMAVSIGIFTRANIKCFETIIKSVKGSFGAVNGHGCLHCHLPEISLQAGLYFVNVGLYPPKWDYMYDYHWQVYALHIKDRKPVNSDISGVVPIYPEWSSSITERGIGMDISCPCERKP